MKNSFIFYLIILLFCIKSNIFCQVNDYKYLDDYKEIHPNLFNNPLVNILSYNVDIKINAEEKTFTSVLSANIVLPSNGLPDSISFSLNKSFLIQKIKFEDTFINEIQYRDDSPDSTNSRLYSFFIPPTKRKINSKNEAEISISYTGTISDEMTNPTKDYFEFAQNCNWYPFINSRTQYKYSLSVTIDKEYTIVSPANLLNRIRSDNKMRYEFDEKHPVSRIVFVALKGMKKKVKKYDDGTVVTLYYKNLSSFNANNVLVEIEWIFGFYSDRFLRIEKEKSITAVFLPRDGDYYVSFPPFFIFPEKEIHNEITEWKPYKQMYHKMCGSVARFWWENCKTDWLRDGLCGYFSLFAMETMFGIDESMKYVNSFEDNISNYSKNIAIVSMNLSFLDREILYKQKVSFVLRTLSYYIGTLKFQNMLKEIAEYAAVESFDRDYFFKKAKEGYGSSLKWFFDQWMEKYSIPVINFDYKIEDIKDGRYKIHLAFKQKGESVFLMGVLFTIDFEEGSEYRKIMFGKRNMRFSLICSNKPLSVSFDKENYILNR